MPTSLDSAAGRSSTGLLEASRGPVHPAAAETLHAAATELGWADSTQRHAPGRRARALLDTAREVLADAVGVRPDELSVHASAEDALAVGLAGLRRARRRVGDRVLASAVERSVVLVDPAVSPVAVDRDGRVDLGAWADGLGEVGVAAAVLQSANGEVGTRQPLAAAGALAARHGVPLLVDATASLGREDVPTAGEVVVADAATFGGPPLGLLGVRTGTRWSRPTPRRDAEHGRSLATPWVPLVLAAAEAWRQGEHDQARDAQDARGLIDLVRSAAAALPDVEVVGDPVDRLPHVVTFSALYTDGEAMVDELATRGLAVGSGSACSSSALRPSHVLAAMGVLTHGNVRLALPLDAVSPRRADDVRHLVTALPEVVADIRRRLDTEGL
ncbi:MAG: aminotransferase class V-fold PLP-dependent enzyme [Dermatophilaceae bacterium]